MLRAVRYYATVVFFLPLIALAIYGQQKVDPGNMYYRIWATLPVVGTGKAGDPVRPMLVPNVAARANVNGKAVVAVTPRTGILGMQIWMSDDGKTALVELVAADRSAFNEILNLRLPGVKVFERGKSTKDDVEKEFQKYKRDFVFDPKTTARVQ